MKARLTMALFAVTVSSLLVSTTPAFAAGVINGSGSTFQSPLIDACKADFTASKDVVVNYAGGGSGRGRADFLAGSLVDFAGSDVAFPYPDPTNVVYVPAFVAPITVMYNLPTVKENIYLSPTTIAKIFSGKIDTWNDPAIDADNSRTIKTPVFGTKQVAVKVKKGKKVTTVMKTVPDVDASGKPVIASYKTTTVNLTLPNVPITVWYRSESSGTSESFTNFLNKTAPTIWTKSKNSTFANSTPKTLNEYFNFQGASGSAPVAAGVASKIGSIGYGEKSFGDALKLPAAYIQNAAGEFVGASGAAAATFVAGASIADNGVVTNDFAKKITGAYPLGIASYSLAYDSGKTSVYQKNVAAWLTYVLDTCASKFPETGFAQITGPLYAKAKSQIALIK